MWSHLGGRRLRTALLAVTAVAALATVVAVVTRSEPRPQGVGPVPDLGMATRGPRPGNDVPALDSEPRPEPSNMIASVLGHRFDYVSQFTNPEA